MAPRKKKSEQQESSPQSTEQSATKIPKRGYKHLIQCRCVLPQFKNRPDPPRHKFIVFSVIDENDKVELKYAQCNHCGLIHKVVDICKSEIQAGKESSSLILTIDDIKISLPADLVTILDKYNAELSTWEQARFILENKEWGNFLLLEQEEESGVKQGKYLRIFGENFYKMENFSREEYVNLEES